MKRFLQLLTREPFVAFVLLGAVLYAAISVVRPEDSTETIEISIFCSAEKCDWGRLSAPNSIAYAGADLQAFPVFQLRLGSESYVLLDCIPALAFLFRVSES